MVTLKGQRRPVWPSPYGDFSTDGQVDSDSQDSGIAMLVGNPFLPRSIACVLRTQDRGTDVRPTVVHLVSSWLY